MTSMSKAVASWSLPVGAFVLACYTAPEGGSSGGGTGATPAVCTPTLASIEATIFAPKCATSGCHTAADGAGGLDLASPGVEARLVGFPSTCKGKPLVAPGSADGSMIVDKLVNAEPSCGGARMPLSGTIEPAEIECITAWIAGLGAGDGGRDAEAGTE